METVSVRKYMFAGLAVFALVAALGIAMPNVALADCNTNPALCDSDNGYYGDVWGDDTGGDSYNTYGDTGYYGDAYNTYGDTGYSGDVWGDTGDAYNTYGDTGYYGDAYNTYATQTYPSYSGCSYGCGGSSYYPTTYYSTPSYTYYPTYSYTPPASNYNNNQNTNVNNNNVNVNVNGGGTTTTYTCAQIGQQGTYPNCYVPHQPTCADQGLEGSYPNCHSHQSNQNVSCNLDASDTSVSEGDRVTLSWDTSGNPNYASINEGIGRVDEDGGSERVTVDSDTTYRLTVRNSDGDEDTCSVTVNVDDNNFSSVSFTGTPVNNPPVVYLSSIPYTGLEDITPTLLSYWLLLIAAAGAGVWFLYRKGMIPAFAFSAAEPMDGATEEGSEAPAETAPEVMSFLAALADGDTDGAVGKMRDAAHTGTPVEDFLASAESAATDAELAAKVAAALEGAKQTGIRGAKEALA